MQANNKKTGSGNGEQPQFQPGFLLYTAYYNACPVPPSTLTDVPVT